MRMNRIALGITGLVVGGVALAAELESKGAARAVPKPAAVVAPAAIVVEMTSATLGEDCGEAPAPAAPDDHGKSLRTDDAKQDSDATYRHCDQTSMQLSVVSGAKAEASTLRVKKIEVFDEKGVRIGELTARAPALWSAASGAYQAWNEKVAPSQSLAVRYVLNQPSWASVPDRQNKMYTMKVLVTVGGADKSLERNVYLRAETRLPPDVDT